MNSIEKAQMIMTYLAGNAGRLTEAQAESFVNYLTVPFPPVRYYGFWGTLSYPLFLYRMIRFKRINAKWENNTGRENPFKGGFIVRRMKDMSNAR